MSGNHYVLRFFVAIFIGYCPVASAGNIGYFYALESDLAALKQRGTGEKSRNPAISVIRVGKYRVYAVKMGSGCTATAISATELFCREGIQMAISTGPAGALSQQFPVGQWVRVQAVIDYQRGSETPAGFGRPADSVQELPAPKDLGKSSSVLVDAAPVRVASGNIFVASTAFRSQLRAETGADCVDMNLSGLVVACAAAKVPLEAWKVISDRADDSASADFRRFIQDYAGEGGALVAQWVAALPPDPADPASHPNLDALLRSGAP